jgi:hypothetical protein
VFLVGIFSLHNRNYKVVLKSKIMSLAVIAFFAVLKTPENESYERMESELLFI